MAPYILKKRNLIHIIDLRQTLRGLITAKKLTERIATLGKYVLFVGTKRQSQSVVKSEAERCGMPYVFDRWPGGLLTNYATIRTRLQRLMELEELEKTGQINLYSKKMVASLRREKRKIDRNLGGVRTMDRLPGLIVIVDPKREQLAAREAKKLGIPTIAWTDTDGDPEKIDVVVPANDDSMSSILIFVRTIADAVLAGRQRAGMTRSVAAMVEEKAEVAAPASEAAATAAEQTTSPAPEPTAGEAPTQG
jgi:small subunit ribosomal protein S2